VTQIQRHVFSEVWAYSTSREPKISIRAYIYLNRIKRTSDSLAKKSDLKTDGNKNQDRSCNVFRIACIILYISGFSLDVFRANSDVISLVLVNDVVSFEDCIASLVNECRALVPR
jgi:hypothetical protein